MKPIHDKSILKPNNDTLIPFCTNDKFMCITSYLPRIIKINGYCNRKDKKLYNFYKNIISILQNGLVDMYRWQPKVKQLKENRPEKTQEKTEKMNRK